MHFHKKGVLLFPCFLVKMRENARISIERPLPASVIFWFY